MTERYSHLTPGHLADATEILDFGTMVHRANVIPITEARLTKILGGSGLVVDFASFAEGGGESGILTDQFGKCLNFKVSD